MEGKNYSNQKSKREVEFKKRKEKKQVLKMRGIYFYDAFNDVDNTDFHNLEFKKKKKQKKTCQDTFN